MIYVIINDAINPRFMFFHGHYNDQVCVSNSHFMINKILTNGYKGKSMTSMGILLSFMSIIILMGPLPLYYGFIAIMI